MAVKKKKTQKRAVRRTVRKKIIKKRAGKKTIKRRPVKKAAAIKKSKEKIVGVVTHYFPKVNAAVIKLKTPLKVGGTVKIKGHTTDFLQNVTSIQVNHVAVQSAKKGQEIGLFVNSRVRQHDTVYNVNSHNKLCRSI
jgi:hypothetical protein